MAAVSNGSGKKSELRVDSMKLRALSSSSTVSLTLVANSLSHDSRTEPGDVPLTPNELTSELLARRRIKNHITTPWLSTRIARILAHRPGVCDGCANVSGQHSGIDRLHDALQRTSTHSSSPMSANTAGRTSVSLRYSAVGNQIPSAKRFANCNAAAA